MPSDESAFEAKAFSSKQEREREAALRLLTRRLQDMETARVVDSTEARVGRPLSEEARKRYRLPSDQVTFFTNTRYRAIRAPDAREQQDIRNLIQETFDSPLFSAAEQRAELREKFLTSYLNYTRNFMIVAQSWADMNVMKSSILITSYNVNEFGRRLASGREIAPSEARGRQQFYLSGPISGTNQHESLDREAARERYGYLFSKGHPSNPQDGPSILKGIGVEP